MKHPLSYRYRITKKSQRSRWCLGWKEVIKGPRNNPKTNTLIFLL
nr:MAG TPA: hypothetical protein [Caudoviricetes sp.]